MSSEQGSRMRDVNVRECRRCRNVTPWSYVPKMMRQLKR
jgi:hypothetical protein